MSVATALTYPKISKALEYLVHKWGPIKGRTRLIKLLYLADKGWMESHREPFTEARYYRYNHGPFAKEIMNAVNQMDGVEVVETAVPGRDGTGYEYAPGRMTRLSQYHLDPEFAQLLDDVAQRWSRAPLQAVLDHVYGSADFKAKNFGEKLLR